MQRYQILVINPGSTSTKIAVFENGTRLCYQNIQHEAAELEQYPTLADQLPYRRDMIMSFLKENGIALADIDVFVGRGGGLIAMTGGTYEVTDLVLEHARTCANGVIHPATLGSQLAAELAKAGGHGAKALVVNPPDVDELQDVARMTGLKHVYRTVHLHALNLKEMAIRHSKSVLHQPYEKTNLIVCHIGGGISVSAHHHGRMIDGFDIVGGEGPMAPTRTGSLSLANILDYMDQTHATTQEMRQLLTRRGGLVSHLGISDTKELVRRKDTGDQYAQMLWDAMLYQIEKCIGAMATVLKGQVDGILLGGGMAYNPELIARISEACSFIAPVSAYPGEFEMEALAAGALRVLTGEEPLKQYTGVPVWQGFPWDQVVIKDGKVQN